MAFHFERIISFCNVRDAAAQGRHARIIGQQDAATSGPPQLACPSRTWPENGTGFAIPP
jgi:hypothetical protein